ncbi:nucleoporin NUP49/NSP49 [Arthroderma uncinatum]|uniref:nucleoporin NUP49/NSP49 n=1 Tax=Arthroderma uncinatum TaxID=74035 RepID=UPI00144AF6BD|nr:nucleoporin NUP49/NSP49 [Arthroderma uncinatum]KAF3490868.1 nucleoporin NUP49/NSP49 [Arthroderma uncinatum]
MAKKAAEQRNAYDGHAQRMREAKGGTFRNLVPAPAPLAVAAKQKKKKDQTEEKTARQTTKETHNEPDGEINSTDAPELNNSGSNPQPATTSTSAGGLFGGAIGGTATSQPQTSNLFAGLGTTTSQPQQKSLFGAVGSNTTTATATQPASGGLFSGIGTSNAQPQQQGGLGGGSLFGRTATSGSQPLQTTAASSGPSLFSLGTSTANQNQAKPSLFGGTAQGTGTSTNTGGLLNPTGPLKQDQSTGNNVVSGVKIDVSNLVPTTKFESCSDELKREIEAIDTFILNQVRMCNEVSDLLPTISAQGAMIPNDVEFVQGKLDTLQEALENDANGIEHARNLAKQDATEAKLAFRTLDTLLLPLQYQPSPGERWWPAGQQGQSMSKHPLRSTMGLRHGGTLALPEGIEADSNGTSQNEPGNLVDYFSQRTDDMGSVLEEYRKNLKDIEDHLYNVEDSLQRKIHGLVSSRGRDGGNTANAQSSRVRELAATLGDVETAILGVATRVGSAKEEVQELALGPLGVNGTGVGSGWQSRAY